MPPVLPLDPPQRLVHSLEGRPNGAAAADWLTALPRLLEQMLEEWDLTAERVVSPGGRSSLIVLVRLPDGTPGTLKLTAPGSSATLEQAALAHWDGWGAVRVLRSRTCDGALLLERLHGEVSLRSLPETQAMLEAASAVRRLWVAPPEGHGFGTVEKHTAAAADTLLAQAPAEVAPLVDEALALRASLVAGAPEAVLLHGDFRQGAVLAAGGERAQWLAVGPEPLIGERAFDLARLVRDRLHDLLASAGAPAVTRRRIHRLADSLEVDRERLRGWTLYRAVESGVRNLSRGSRADGEALLEFAGWV
ncbi:aminoglycoside phosphotransferase family protein [Streptomyces sp. N2-109]|uniref:Aminoglycoside phosphotransferase family protein n=1 Tax=Streptomyces gossypii TaxID=2883101 RepID=A0ABT2K492_9ACTN|nr:aminoglycoside phosphotransferase family protein [Streptomyces gossypii]MCT2594821.1 aminoglycoside phosphotransferase family protein [Streptomyces gossypii]